MNNSFDHSDGIPWLSQDNINDRKFTIVLITLCNKYIIYLYIYKLRIITDGPNDIIKNTNNNINNNE